MRRTRAMLARIGPRPGLLARYIAHRLWSSVSLRLLRRTYGLRVVHCRGRLELAPWPFRLPTAAELPAELAGAAVRIREEADAACAHTFDLLGSGPTELGERIDWHRDFKSGYVWPRVFYQDVPVTRLDDDSDAKVPWELSRCHQLPALARAACLFEEPRYGEELVRQLEDWIAANPPGVGINWTNTMEVALRAVSWVWAIGTLEGRQALPRTTRDRAIASLAVHGRHIAANLEGSPYLRSNHYLADVLGLLALGWALRGSGQPDRWFRGAHGAFEREIRAQVLEDGVDFEASTGYHGLVLEIFILARWICAVADQPLSAGFDERLMRMLEFSRSIRHPDGRAPLFGDNDSGRVLPTDRFRPPSHDNLLWLGAAVLPGQPAPEVPGDAEAAWTFGVEAWRAATARPAGEPARRAFPQGGYYVLAGGDSHVAVRCGAVGQNGNGGHAHNDLLSFEAWLGEPFVLDPGTSDYTADPPARNWSRSTAAHNGVMVEGQEINPIDPGDLFHLVGVARPSVREWTRDARTIRLRAGHDGYRRLAQRIVHTRSFELDATTGELVVADDLTGVESCSAEAFLHLAPGVTATVRSDRLLALEAPGGTSVLLSHEGDDAAIELGESWVSPRFGVREPAQVVVARIAGPLPLRFSWRFSRDRV